MRGSLPPFALLSRPQREGEGGGGGGGDSLSPRCFTSSIATSPRQTSHPLIIIECSSCISSTVRPPRATAINFSTSHPIHSDSFRGLFLYCIEGGPGGSLAAAVPERPQEKSEGPAPAGITEPTSVLCVCYICLFSS